MDDGGYAFRQFTSLYLAALEDAVVQGIKDGDACLVCESGLIGNGDLLTTPPLAVVALASRGSEEAASVASVSGHGFRALAAFLLFCLNPRRVPLPRATSTGGFFFVVVGHRPVCARGVYSLSFFLKH